MTRSDLIIRILTLFLVLLTISAMLVYGYYVHGQRPLAVNPPDGSAFLLGKMFVAVAAALCIMFALRSPVLLRRDRELSPQVVPAIVISALGITAAAYLAIFEPLRLNDMIQELRPIATFTEFGLTIALVPLGLATCRLYRSGKGTVLGIPGWLLVSGLCLAVFLIAMEEASWGQHWFGWGTPEVFAANRQNETNFHNFYTHRFEFAFYSAATAAFIMLPALWPVGQSGPFSGVDFYVPPAWFGLVFLPVCALVFDEWNALPQEIPIYLGLFSGAIIAYRMRAAGQRAIGFSMVGVLVVMQILILLFAFGLPEGYEVSEIRELYIAAAVLTYSVLLYRRAGLAVARSSA